MITHIPTITGMISQVPTIDGRLNLNPKMNPQYEGPYELTPNPREDTVLNTLGMLLHDDITVNKIPYHETSNEDGTTVTIGG